LQELKVQTMEKELPKLEASLKEAERQFLATRARLLEQKLILRISRSARIRVLDIGDHYAKVEGLDGEIAGKVVFIAPDRLLVK